MTWSPFLRMEIEAEMREHSEHERDDLEWRQHLYEIEKRRAKTDAEVSRRAFRRKVDPVYRAAQNERQAREKRERYHRDPVHRAAKLAERRARYASAQVGPSRAERKAELLAACEAAGISLATYRRRCLGGRTHEEALAPRSARGRKRGAA